MNSTQSDMKSRQAIREKIANDTKAYLESGNKIDVRRMNESQFTTKYPANRITISEKSIPYSEEKLKKRKCVNCGNLYEPKGRTQKYCTEKCPNTEFKNRVSK